MARSDKQEQEAVERALEDAQVQVAIKDTDAEGSPEDLQRPKSVEGPDELVEAATIENGDDPEAAEPDRSDLNLVTNTLGELVRVERV